MSRVYDKENLSKMSTIILNQRRGELDNELALVNPKNTKLKAAILADKLAIIIVLHNRRGEKYV